MRVVIAEVLLYVLMTCSSCGINSKSNCAGDFSSPVVLLVISKGFVLVIVVVVMVVVDMGAGVVKVVVVVSVVVVEVAAMIMVVVVSITLR